MAKYEIEHTCGCVETVNICGTNVHGERERKAAWLASKPCYKCQRKMDEAAGKAKPKPKDAKQAVFTEKNKRDFPKLLGFMRERLAGNDEVLAAVDEFEKACREHMDDFSICSGDAFQRHRRGVAHELLAKVQRMQEQLRIRVQGSDSSRQKARTVR